MPNYDKSAVEEENELKNLGNKTNETTQKSEGKRKKKFSFRKEKHNSSGETKQGFGKIIGGYVDTLKKKEFRTVMLGYSVSLIASIFITSVGMHLFTFCYHFSSSQISIIMICLLVGQFYRNYCG